MSVNIAELLVRANNSLQQHVQTITLHQRETYLSKVPLFIRTLSELAQIIGAQASDDACVKAINVKLGEFLTLLKYINSDEDILALKSFRDFAKAAYESGPTDPRFCRGLLLARLLLKPYEVNHPTELSNTPPELLAQIFDYQLETVFFINPGDQAGYLQNLDKIVSFYHNILDSFDVQHVLVSTLVERLITAFPLQLYYITDWKVLPFVRLANRLMRFLGKGICPSLSYDWEPPARDPNSKIKIGVVLKTFMCGGETWAALANIAALDRSKYEINLLCLNNSIGYTHDIRYYREILPLVDNVVLIPLARVDDAVSFIRNMNLDILWHQTHMGLANIGPLPLIFVYRLARKQVADFGMHAFTTGNPYYTHFFGIEPLIEGRNWDDDFSEKYMYGKGIHIYIPDHWDEPPNISLQKCDLGIADDAVVYFVGASAAKHTAESFAVCMNILKKVPNAVLVLYPANPAWNPRPSQVFTFQAIVDKAIKSSGIEPSRIKIVPHVNGQAIAQMHSWGDIYLSSYPYGGVTSLSDALRGGLCPVSAACQSARGCGEAPILEGYGLLDLMARTEQAYEDLAVRLGLDASYRSEIKGRVITAWATKRDGMKDHVAKEHAKLIDRVAEEL